MDQVGGPSSSFLRGLSATGKIGDTSCLLDELRDAVIAGNYLPGTAISIDAVARLYGVSPIPVREALKVLVGEGLVDHTPGVGYTTSVLTLGELEELRRARRALEVAAIETLVGGRARALLDSAVPTPRPSSARDWLVEERRFHLSLLEATGMPRLTETYRRLWNVAERQAALMCPTAVVADRLRRDHQDLQLALRAGDLERANAVLTQHYERMDEAAEPHRDDPRFFVTGPQAAG